MTAPAQYALVTQQALNRQLLTADGSSPIEVSPLLISGSSGSALTQAAWFIDGVNGNDNNPGTSALPVKTVMGGIVPKWGSNVVALPQTTTFFVVQSQAPDLEDIVLDITMTGEGASFGIIGTYQVLATGTVGTVTARNRATGQKLVTHPPVAAVGLTIVHNTQAGKLSRAYVESAAAGAATMQQPQSIAPGAGAIPTGFVSFPTEVNTWAATDTCTVEAPTGLNLRSLTVRSASNTDPTFTFSSKLWIQAIEVVGSPGKQSTIVGEAGMGVFFADCLWTANDPFPTFFADVSTVFEHFGCLWEVGFQGQNNQFVLGGGVSQGGSGVQLQFFGSNNLVDNDVQVNGGIITGGAGQIGYGTAYTAGASGGLRGFSPLPPTVGGNRIAATLTLQNGLSSGTVALWGPGSLNAICGTSVTRISSNAPSWATMLLLTGSLDLEGVTTGNTFNAAAGTWSTPITITPAALDANGSIVNPLTGSRFDTGT